MSTMLINEEISTQVERELKRAGISIREKREVAMHRFIATLLFFLPEYLTRFSSTLSRKYIDLSDKHWHNPFRWGILLHEAFHISDMKQFSTLGFKLLYSFPQNLAVLSVLTFWHWQFVFCLLFLLPLPALGRLFLESRAYAFDLAIDKMTNSYSLVKREYMISSLAGKNYYFALPSKKLVDKILTYWERKHTHLLNTFFMMPLTSLEVRRRPELWIYHIALKAIILHNDRLLDKLVNDRLKI